MDIRNKLIESIHDYEDDDKMKSFIVDEALLGEDYPDTFNIDDLTKQTSYAAKKRYVEQHLKRIGSGSARIVYLVDNSKVLKLAKNDKGIAQNQVESQGYFQNEYADVITKLFNTDYDDYWIEMELAKKLTPKRFKELTGLDFDTYGRMLRYILDNIAYGLHPSQGVIDWYYEHEFAGEIIQMAEDSSMPSGDLTRINSYGEVIRNGKPAVVLVDYGLDSNVHSDYYKK